MILCKLGIRRDVKINPWVSAGELHFSPSGKAHLSMSALTTGLLLGRAMVEDAPYLDGDIYSGDQWIGFMMTSETDTGVWYTSVIELIPMVSPSPAGRIVLEVKDAQV